MAGGKSSREDAQEGIVSRIVVEFAGPGMADVKNAVFENVSVGQMMAFAAWAKWQMERAILKMELQRQREAELQKKKIAVPKGVLVQ